jgi:glycosyltransferase involved in cell wall biosynthesis
MKRTVVHYTDTAIFGGAERALLILLSGLDRRRWRPVLFCHDEAGTTPLATEARQLDITVRVLPDLRRGRHRVHRIIQFIRALKAERPAVFHAHLSWPLACRSALLAASAARTPAIVATAHLHVPITSLRGIFLQRLISTRVDRYLAVSAEVGRGLRLNFGLPERKIEIVHNAIPLAAFERSAPEGLRAMLTREAEGPIVLTAARLHEQKGIDVLLDAAALVPGATFVVAGDGPLRQRLEARACQLEIAQRVVFLGQRHDVPDLMAAADLFVLPSFYEGLPLTVLEAMASGTPVIATAIGGTDEVISNGRTGVLVPPRDAHALAHAIERLLRDPDLARQLGRAGRAHVSDHFAVDTMIARVSNVYDAALAARPVPALVVRADRP